MIKEPDLPQLAEIKLPRQTDVAQRFLLYDEFMKRVYPADAQTGERLRAARVRQTGPAEQYVGNTIRLRKAKSGFTLSLS